MVTPRDKLYRCVSFQWDDGNATKNWNKRDVFQVECEEVFFNRPLIIKRDRRHSSSEERYYGLGRTGKNRPLFVVFTIREDKIRVISARDMTAKERKRYPL